MNVKDELRVVRLILNVTDWVPSVNYLHEYKEDLDKEFKSKIEISDNELKTILKKYEGVDYSEFVSIVFKEYFNI